MLKKIGTLLAAALLFGCTAELHHALDERDANEIVVELEANGIEAGKSRDVEKGRWMVHVPRGVRIEALRVLQTAGLPKPKTMGYASFYPSDGLIPTASEEHVLQQFAQSEEIRKSLLTIDGVLDAHVNLVLPLRSKIRLNAVPIEPGRASVVIKHRGPKPPIAEADVQRVVAGAVSAMEPVHVTVVMTASKPTATAGAQIESVGPIAVAAGSKTLLVSILVGFITTFIMLGAAIAFVLLRRRG